MTTDRVTRPPGAKRTALVLSGGGARGAYEVGVLSYVYDELTRVRGVPPAVDTISGTSVGAINGCYLAAHMADPVSGVRRLVDLWTSVRFEQVLRFGLNQALRLPRLLRGGSEAAGLFDVQPMVDLITKEISWRMVARSLRRGLLRALSVSATEISTGRTTIFVETAPDVTIPGSLGVRTIVRPESIGPQHALASAAIPLVFPPVRIGAQLYCDGGLRQNTPIAPAIRMGAERVLVIGLSKEVRGAVVSESGGASGSAAMANPGAFFLLGKVLNAFLLDHVQADLELLGRINQVLIDGEVAIGAAFGQRLTEAASVRGGEAYRKVETLVVRPSQDIGLMAGQHVRHGRFASPFAMRQFLGLLDSGEGEEADLASYLLFDGSFARKLINLGRADAGAVRDKLMDFFS